MVSGGGHISTSSGGILNTILLLTTDSLGKATIYFQQPTSVGVVSGISASTSGHSTSFVETSGIDAPTASPPGGSYYATQTVTVSSTVTGATIYYTTDGTSPTTSSLSVSSGGTLTVSCNTLYKFMAGSSGLTGPITTALYRIAPTGALQAGDSFTMVRKPDGTVWTWGDNGRGQQGDGEAENPNPHPQQLPSLSSIISVAAAGDHAFALSTTGTVWAWGADDQAQCGDNGTNDISTPISLSGISNIAAIFAGQFQGFAVDNSENLYGWGDNSSGQLGDGTFTNRPSPEQIGLMSGVVKVCSGSGSDLTGVTLVLKNDGSVWACGANAHGELGVGVESGPVSAFQPVPGMTNVIDIAVGYDSWYGGHCLALKADGTVWAWGADWWGELGDALSYESNPNPQQVTLPPAIAVFAVDTHSYVLLSHGSVAVFGNDSDGESGDGQQNFDSPPTQPLQLPTVTSLAAGQSHVVVSSASGALYGWGNNTNFRLTQDFNSFQQSTEVHDDRSQNFTAVANAVSATIALKSDGSVWATGSGYFGLVTNGQTSDEQFMTVPLGNIQQVVGGNNTAFAIDSSGNLWAWGADYTGQLGLGEVGGQAMPYSVNAPLQVANVSNVIAVAAGDSHMLVVQGTERYGHLETTHGGN